jgi:flagellum-specific peptidoglycan hydrolase FlgJ
MKQHAHEIFGTMTLPTQECLDGKWIACSAQWVKYPDWRSCFADRLATLQRLSNAYPHYAAALNAPDAETFVTEVSKTWSTDPGRAQKVIAIYQDYISNQGATPP